jgi:hypothetical protein
MAKYLLLYRSSATPGEQMANATPEQAEAGMAAWMDWGQKAGEAIVDFGSPVANVKAVGSDNAGPSGTHIGGFSILEAGSLETLTELLSEHPHLQAPDGSIEVLEFLTMPGM